MNIALWVAQGLLALTFLSSGGIKAVETREVLVKKLPAVGNFTIETIRSIGLAEILGALGLILPGTMRIDKILTPIAAVCLAILMVPAALIHLRRKEANEIVVNLVVIALAVFVAVGRFSSHPL